MDNKTLFELKDKYWNLYYSEIDGYEFLWRELSRGEYKKGLRLYEDESDLEEYICRTCVLEPEDFDFEECPAGIPSVLAEYILVESGFSATSTGKIDGYLQKYRAEMQTFDNQVSCIIHEAFPTLNLEEIENWPTEKTIWYFSRAEYILNQIRLVDLQYTSAQNQQPAQNQPQTQEVRSQQTSPEYQGAQVKTEFTEGEGYDSSIYDFEELGELQKFTKKGLDEEFVEVYGVEDDLDFSLIDEYKTKQARSSTTKGG